MARTKKTRIYYSLDNPSVHISKESMIIIKGKIKELDLSRKDIEKMVGCSKDVVRHLLDDHHIRLNSLKVLIEKLDLNAVLEETVNDAK